VIPPGKATSKARWPELRWARLTGPRVQLTSHTRDDAVDLFPLVYKQAPVLDMLIWDGPEDLESLATFLSTWRSGGGAQGLDYFFTIRLLDGTAVGHCGVRFSEWERASGLPRVGDIGYWMGTAFWGQGLMTEAARLLVALAFEELAADGVSARCLQRNIGSQRVLEKSGLVRDRTYQPDKLEHGACELRYTLERANYKRVPAHVVAFDLEFEN
jgi:[ribosomal protein S5]-alanine N-acetyltransferase